MRVRFGRNCLTAQRARGRYSAQANKDHNCVDPPITYRVDQHRREDNIRIKANLEPEQVASDVFYKQAKVFMCSLRLATPKAFTTVTSVTNLHRGDPYLAHIMHTIV